MNDLPLFINDTIGLLENRFNVIYDNVNLLTVKGGIGYQRQQVFNVNLNAAYYLYSTDREIKAWHKPNYEAGLSASYTFLKKYTVDAALIVSGGRYSKTYTGGEHRATELKEALDLNLGFEYRHNKSWSAFFRANNLLDQHYQLWYNYPVQGLQVMVGATYSF